MFTIFDVFALIGPCYGVFVGATKGYHYYGWWGGIAGAIVGFLIGLTAGRLPFLLAIIIVNFGGKSTAQLRQVFRDDQYYIYHLALAALMERGEDISQVKPVIIATLASPDEDKRRFGWAALQLGYTDLAAALERFNPQSPLASHLQQIEIWLQKS